MLILLKCIVVGYSNGNESFTGRLLSNYGPLNMLFHFFRYLIYSVFHETFVKKFMKKLSFFSSNLKYQFQDVVHYRKLGCLTLWYWIGDPLNIRKMSPFLGLFFRNKKCWHFHEWNISVMISHFSKNDLYGSSIVEIMDRRTWKQNWKQIFDCKLVYILGKTVQGMVLECVWMTFKLSNNKLHHWFLLSVLIKF